MSARLIKSSESSLSAYMPLALPVAGAAPGLNGAAAARTALLPPNAPPPVPHASAPQALSNANPTVTSIEEARIEVTRLIAESHAQAAEIESQARDRGLAEAHAAIAEEVGRQVEPLREQLSQTLADLVGLRASIAARAERDLVRLAIEIARKIVHREVSIDHEIALTLARIALSKVNSRAVATVRLHPDDYLYVQARCEQLETNGSIEIVEDRSIGRGGCLVQTEMGDVDARIEHQFQEIERSFLEV